MHRAYSYRTLVPGYTGVRGFRWAIENVPNRKPTACSTSSPPGFCFLGRQLPKIGISPILYVLPNQQPTDCKLIGHRSTTSAVYIAFLFHFVVKGSVCSFTIFTLDLNTLQASAVHAWHTIHYSFDQSTGVIVNNTVSTCKGVGCISCATRNISMTSKNCPSGVVQWYLWTLLFCGSGCISWRSCKGFRTTF